MKKYQIVILRSTPSASIEVPESFPRKRGEPKPKDPREIARSGHGALRLFPGIPKTVTSDELEYVEGFRPEVFRRLEVRPYVESTRRNVRAESKPPKPVGSVPPVPRRSSTPRTGGKKSSDDPGNP